MIISTTFNPLLRDLPNFDQEIGRVQSKQYQNTYSKLNKWVYQNRHFELGKRLDFRKSIEITIEGRMVMENLNLDNKSVFKQKLPERLSVTKDINMNNLEKTQFPDHLYCLGNFTLFNCTLPNKFAEDYIIGGQLNISSCFFSVYDKTQPIDLPNWVLNVSDITAIPCDLERTDTYKKFQILKHFDTYSSIDNISSSVLIEFYNVNKNEIDILSTSRLCFRIAHSMITNQPLTPQQELLKDKLSEFQKAHIQKYFLDICKQFNLEFIDNLPQFNIFPPRLSEK